MSNLINNENLNNSEDIKNTDSINNIDNLNNTKCINNVIRQKDISAIKDILDKTLCYTKQIDAYNLLQEDYIEYITCNNIKEHCKGNEITANLLLVNELKRTHTAHILLCYEITDKIRFINDNLNKVYDFINKVQKINGGN